MTDAIVRQIAREVLRDGPGTTNAFQVGRQVMRDGPGDVLGQQAMRMVLRSGPDTGRLALAYRVVRMVLYAPRTARRRHLLFASL
jgi:hypothetical protein